MELIISFILNNVIGNFVNNIFNSIKEKSKGIFAKTLTFDCKVGQINLGYPEGNCYLFEIEKRDYILNTNELKKKIPSPIKVEKILNNPYSSNIVLSLRSENDNAPIGNINFAKEEDILISLSNNILIDILNSFYLRNNSSETLFKFIKKRLKKKNLSLNLYCPNTDILLYKIPFNNLKGKDFGFPDKLITMISKCK